MISARARDALALLVLIVVASIGRVGHDYVTFSDGVYTYLASAVSAQGPHDLYQHLALSQPPAPVLAAAIVWKLAPTVEAVRVLVAGCAALTIALTFGLARASGLRGWWPLVAAAIAAWAPMRTEFTSLDGEMLLCPLIVGVAWAIAARRWRLAGALLALGTLVKLTWVVPVVAALLVARRIGGWRAFFAAGVVALGCTVAAWTALFVAFEWSPHAVYVQLIAAQSGSGWQPSVPALAVAVAGLLWWPMFVVVPSGIRHAPRPLVEFTLLSLVALGFTLKQGTFFNVLAPSEPLLAILCAHGAATCAKAGGVRRASAMVAVSVVFVLFAIAAVGPVQRRLPLGLGGGLVDVHNQSEVDHLTRVVGDHSSRSQAVLVNPLLAVLAHRRLPDDQADWFILHAMHDCDVRPPCGAWDEMLDARYPVVGIDRNVTAFEPGFTRSRLAPERSVKVADVDRAPLSMRLYAAPTGRSHR